MQGDPFNPLSRSNARLAMLALLSALPPQPMPGLPEELPIGAVEWGPQPIPAPNVGGRSGTKAPRRCRKKVKPTVAELVRDDMDGPDPAELPRRRRRMLVPKPHEFHTHARERRKPR